MLVLLKTQSQEAIITNYITSVWYFHLIQAYYQTFALVANNGDCHCADQHTLVRAGSELRASPLECMGRCQGYDASQDGEYCGMEGTG